MYNRYIRNDNGHYNRVLQQDTPQTETTPIPTSDAPPSFNRAQTEPSRNTSHTASSSHAARPNELRFLDKILARFHLSDIDSGDLILLLLLFFLFHEDGDEELMIALGLLLIL